MGIFITAEGGEGSGKTTHLKTMADWLEDLGYKVVLTRDSGATEIGDTIRPLILDKKYDVSREAELLLYLACRAELVDKVILPGLETADFVLCDRFFDSTFDVLITAISTISSVDERAAAYQGIIRGWDSVLLNQMHRKFSRNVIPDHTFLFDVDPKIGLSRSEGYDKNESKWEELKIHQKINNAFLDRAWICRERFSLIDANKDIDDVWEDFRYEFIEIYKDRDDFRNEYILHILNNPDYVKCFFNGRGCIKENSCGDAWKSCGLYPF